MRKITFVLTLLSAVAGSHSAWAAVSPEQAKQLGNNLTPVGAEKAGNKAGTIPAWTGDFKAAGPGLSDPFAGESATLRIAADNVHAHKAHLTDGQVAMLQRYPDSYFLDVYPSHRTAVLPASVQEAAKYNARNARLSADANGVEGYKGYYPFPSPKNGLEAVWNHFMRYRGGSLLRDQVQVVTQANGSYSEVRINEQVVWPEKLDGYDEVGELTFSRASPTLVIVDHTGVPDSLRGKAAILAAWGKYFEGAQAPFSWRPETVVVLDGGQLAQTKGPVFDPEGKPIMEFRSTWRRDPDGRWKVVFDDGTCLCGKRG